MSDFTVRINDPPEVTDASRDVRFIFSPSGTVHERPETREDDDVPVDRVWHWEVVEVTERTRQSVRLQEIREEVLD